MTDGIDTRKQSRSLRVLAAPKHKFAVGLHVSYRDGPGLHRVTRHLPDGGHGLQYRIQSDQDGRERVVVEIAIERAR